MKNICITLLFVFLCSFAQGQTGSAISGKTPVYSTFLKGDNVAALGLGFGGTLYSGSGYSSKMPFLSLSYERCVKDHLFDDKSSLGVGGILGYTSSKWEYEGIGWKYSDIVIGVRGALHYAFVNKLDTYTGLMLGYDILSSKIIGEMHSEWDYSASTGGFVWAWYLGARYYFTDSFAGFAEVGYGVSIINLGVAMKF